ncbi:ComEA family DNA-binding protein [Leadbetterella byssophila]|uniref:ComEA family DNA-binding protein n=1 Tax=Leadbetterella byssophila TaxID=316068 RepID=UPI00399FF2E5
MKKLMTLFWDIPKKEAQSIRAFMLLLFFTATAYYLLKKHSTESKQRVLLTIYPYEAPVYQRFHFDPNTLTEDSLALLGIPEKTMKSMINFRSKGGKFRTKEDLQKIYNFPPVLYDSLAPWIKIQTSPKPQQKIIAMDLNLADSTDLVTLKGIGKTFASRIIKYRTALGGFHSLDQLNEIYGLKPETIAQIRPYLKIKTPVSKIKINEVAELKHPYLRSYQAKAILAYRKQHGEFKDLDDLKNIDALDEETLANLLPYLQF